jgi:hypothetical protein
MLLFKWLNIFWLSSAFFWRRKKNFFFKLTFVKFDSLDYHEEFFQSVFVNHLFEVDHLDHHSLLHQQLIDQLDFWFHSMNKKKEKENHLHQFDKKFYLTKFCSMKFFHCYINFGFKFWYCITNDSWITNIGIVFWIIRCWWNSFSLWLINLLFLNRIQSNIYSYIKNNKPFSHRLIMVIIENLLTDFHLLNNVIVSNVHQHVDPLTLVLMMDNMTLMEFWKIIQLELNRKLIETNLSGLLKWLWYPASNDGRRFNAIADSTVEFAA